MPTFSEKATAAVSPARASLAAACPAAATLCCTHGVLRLQLLRHTCYLLQVLQEPGLHLGEQTASLLGVVLSLLLLLLRLLPRQPLLDEGVQLHFVLDQHTEEPTDRRRLLRFLQ